MSHCFYLRVYYEDTDFSALVYHGAYVRFLERGRTEYLRDNGLTQQNMFAEEGFAFVVRAMGIEFLRPARMDDWLEVRTQLKEISGASLSLEQKILRGDELLIEAEIKIACLRQGKISRLPAHARARLAQSAKT